MNTYTHANIVYTLDRTLCESQTSRYKQPSSCCIATTVRVQWHADSWERTITVGRGKPKCYLPSQRNLRETILSLVPDVPEESFNENKGKLVIPTQTAFREAHLPCILWAQSGE